MKHWNLKHLHEQMTRDLPLCDNAFERRLFRGVYEEEIKELAAEIESARALTPGESAIASEAGYRPMQ